MNKSKSYFVIKNPKQSKNITENELVSNLNQLMMEEKLLQIPIEVLIGKGYSYQELQNYIEVDGYLNVMQEIQTETEIKEQMPVNFTVSSTRNIFNNSPKNVSMDIMYADTLCQNLIEAVKSKKNLTSYLAALEEYNTLTQSKDLKQEQNLEEVPSPKM